jgi:UDP-N-acetylmuramoyl-L-alanyl-D-glutamate--2,6-diaminopimelate ligase
MVAKILEEAGKKVAVASTINFRINEVEEKNLSHYTTESSFAVQKFIRKAVCAECEYLVLETSSHSLDQYRVWGVKYHTAVITNVTREHLDYHKTMEKYRKAKRKLFGNVEVAVVNLNMEKPEEYLNCKSKLKFGFTTLMINDNPPAGGPMTNIQIVKADNIELGIQDTRYKIQDASFTLHLPGLFNVENALAATCVGLSENINLETMSKALEKIKGISGRLEHVKNDRGLNIIVDFALTPNALEKLYELLYSTKKENSKIIAVFGSCGERDRGKRPIMGEIVSKYADFMIITNDEPYHEDPNQIIDEIIGGIKNKKEGENFWKITDRRQAIKKALEIGFSGDIVVVTGMGNFETMVVGDEKIPWNDRNVIKEELAKIK